jgi:5-oxoprolinase (ATP-hydrolysing)
VTDANLLLGRLQPAYFPHIFGPTEDQPLDVDATRAAFERLCATALPAGTGAAMSLDEVAYGFVQVANEAMCRPIRVLTQARGFDTKHHILACFGGAGAQHGARRGPQPDARTEREKERERER